MTLQYETNVAKLLRTLMLSSTAALAFSWAAPVAAQPAASQQRVEFQIPAQSLESALAEYARQSAQQLLFSPEIVEGKSANAIVGELDPLTALDRLLTGSGLVYSRTTTGAILIRDPARAENDGAANGDEEIVVTGSRLATTIADSNAPITVTTRNEIEYQGAVNAEALIRDLPLATPARSAATNNNGNGNTSLNLRNLGEARTLVLVDNHRLPAADFGGVPDINSIPANMIERIEVVTGGASAVYGSDAIAGVVNFILRDDFQGVELSMQYGLYDEGDGETFDANLIFGANSADGRGNVTGYLGYTSREEVLARDRSWAESELTSDGMSLVPTGSIAIAEGLFVDIGPGGLRFNMFNENREIVPYDGRVYNAQFNRFVMVPQERYVLGAIGHYEMSPAFDPYFRVSFSQNNVIRQVGEPPIVVAPGPSVNYGNPLLSAQQRDFLFGPGPHADDELASLGLQFARRITEGGPRFQERNNYQQFQLVLGAEGELASGFDYDVSAQYGRTDWTQRLFGDIAPERFQQGLIVNPDGTCVDPTGGCVPIDIFAPGALTPEQLNFFMLDQQANSNASQFVAMAAITGDLGEVGIGSPWAESDPSIALGGEYRRESASYDPDDRLAVGNNNLFGAIPATSGEVDVWDVFTELRLPIIEDAPGIHLLEANVGYRRSEYNLAGTADAYGYGLTWAPIEDIRFRGSFQRAVRAPNIGELFAPAQPSAEQGVDPCFASPTAGGPSASQALCEATGVPAVNYGDIAFQCQAIQCTTLVGGNRDLDFEESDTKSFGIVLLPRSAPNLLVTVDYFDITVNGAIAPFGTVQSIFDSCYGTDAGENPTQDPNHPSCQQIVRAADGRAQGGGRLSQPDGYVSLLNDNIGFLRTEGVDTQISYHADFADWGLGIPGGFEFNTLATYVDRFDQQANLLTPVRSCAGTFGTNCGQPIPQWRVNTRLTWLPTEALAISGRWRYISDVTRDIDEASGTVADPVAHQIDSQSYFDLTGRWAVSDKVELSLGVLNIADEDPPLLPSFVATPQIRGLSNTFAGTYDIGRQFFVSLTARY